MRTLHRTAAFVMALAPAGWIVGLPLDLGKASRATLPNGLTLNIVERPDVSLVRLSVIVSGGSASDPAGKGGLRSLTAEMLRRGSVTHTGPEIEETLDSLGATLTIQTDADTSSLDLELLSKDVPAGLELLADLLTRPSFDAEEFGKEREQRVARLDALKDDPGTWASEHFQARLYGSHPYGHPVDGTGPTVAAISREEVVAHHHAWFVPRNCLLVVVGGVRTPALVQAIRTRFGKWEGGNPPRLALPAPSPAPRGVLLLDRPDSTQSQVRLGSVGIPRSDLAWDALELANTVLGGGFTSRLVERIRVDLSLTYNIYSRAEKRRARGPLFIFTFTPTQTTRRIVDETVAVVEQFRESGPTAEELDKAKGFEAGLLAIRLQSLAGTASALADEWIYGLPQDSTRTAVERYRAVTLEQAQAAAKRYSARDAVVVVLGKAEAVRPQLEGLGPISVEPATKDP